MLYTIKGIGFTKEEDIVLEGFELELDEENYIEEGFTMIPKWSGDPSDFDEEIFKFYDYEAMLNDAREYFNAMLDKKFLDYDYDIIEEEGRDESRW